MAGKLTHIIKLCNAACSVIKSKTGWPHRKKLLMAGTAGLDQK